MDISLVILAAGMGSRYGGIKQLDEFGENGARIIDFTIYDALKAGFNKVVFVIRKEIEKDFINTIGHKWKDIIDVHIVYQEISSIPKDFKLPNNRTKPWGTAHAVWMAQSEVKEPFTIVNADDFYGRDALQTAANYLKKMGHSQEAFMVGYQLKNTLTDFGYVSRGICEVDSNNFLAQIVERTKIYVDNNQIVYEENGQKHILAQNSITSMNLMGFTPDVFDEISEGFSEIYKQSFNNPNVEYFIPSILNNWIKKGVKVPLLNTSSKWFGVTYPEDKAHVKSEIQKLFDKGTYPKKMW